MFKISGMLIFLTVSMQSLAMQALSDETLAKATAQDGITLSLASSTSTISYSSLSVTDKDGFSTSYAGAASVSIAPSSYTANTGIKLLDNNGGAIQGDLLTIKVDSDAHEGSPLVNLNVALNKLSKIEVTPFDIYLHSGSGTVYGDKDRVLGAGAQTDKIVQGANHLFAFPTISIDFTEGTSLSFNMQLGNAAQHGMVQVSSGSLQRISTKDETIQVFSKGGEANDKLTFGLDIVASNSTTGYRLHAFNDASNNFSGFYAGLNQEQFYLKADGRTDALDVSLGQLNFGQAGVTADSFNGMQNSSMGTIGATGLTVTDLELTVQGL